MPTYQYICDSDDGGCDNVIEFTCLMSEKDDKQPKSCPACRKRKPLHQLFGCAEVHVHTTLGVYADKQSTKLSADERHHLTNKHNEYRKSDGQPSFVQQSDGSIVHRDKLEGR